MPWNNFWNFLAGGTAAGEQTETRDSYAQVKTLSDRSPYADENRESYIVDIVAKTCNRAGVVPMGLVTEALGLVVDDLLTFDSVVFGLPTVASHAITFRYVLIFSSCCATSSSEAT